MAVSIKIAMRSLTLYICACAVFFIIGFASSVADAITFPQLVIEQALSVNFEGPPHHGFTLTLNAASGENLTQYEVHFKEMTANPLEAWRILTVRKVCSWNLALKNLDNLLD